MQVFYRKNEWIWKVSVSEIIHRRKIWKSLTTQDTWSSQQLKDKKGTEICNFGWRIVVISGDSSFKVRKLSALGIHAAIPYRPCI